MASKVYKINTSQNSTEYLEADAVELNMSLNRVDFYLDEVPVGSYTGYMGFSVHNPELDAQIRAAILAAEESQL